MGDAYKSRPLCNWGDGDLPAPHAVGDVVDIPAGAKALERMDGMGPGRYRVVCVFSIDDGDAWYVRVAKDDRRWRRNSSSDRLHIASRDRQRVSPGWPDGGVDWLEGCTLVRTVDPDGLTARIAMLAMGWKLDDAILVRCPTCAGTGKVPKATG